MTTKVCSQYSEWILNAVNIIKHWLRFGVTGIKKKLLINFICYITGLQLDCIMWDLLVQPLTMITVKSLVLQAIVRSKR